MLSAPKSFRKHYPHSLELKAPLYCTEPVSDARLAALFFLRIAFGIFGSGGSPGRDVSEDRFGGFGGGGPPPLLKAL